MQKRFDVSIERLEARRLFASALVISHGGTYTGTWESDDPKIPAVSINTKEPVIIENSTVRSRSDLIVAAVDHSNVTIRNTTGIALNPNVLGKAPGRFFGAEIVNNLVLQNNDLQNTRGIHILGYGGDFSTGQTIKVLDNRATNIDGRYSNGKGGWLDFNLRTRLSDKVTEAGFAPAQFIQLDKVRKLPGIEIARNQIINLPGQSRVEDNISIYKSSGTLASPILIHDNYIQGAYTIKPWQGNTSDATYSYDWGYSGGGILLGDGGEKTASGNPAFAKAYDNTVVDTTNYGIAISGGHDMTIESNRVLSAGKLSDGRAIAAQNVGIYIWDSLSLGGTYFYKNIIKANTVGWINPIELDGRNDWWLPSASSATLDKHWASTPTLAAQSAERATWESAHKMVGTHGTLAGLIFKDADGDGILEAKDVAASQFKVFVDLNLDGLYSSNEPTATSSSSGRYSLAMKPGTYSIRLMPTSGWRPSKGAFQTLTVAAGGTATRYFGQTQIPLITGLVYMDADQDGGHDPSEPGLGHWTIYIDLDHDGVLDANEPSTHTNRFGRYALSGTGEGMFQVRIVPQPTYKMISPGAGYRSVTLVSGQIVEGRNFGEKPLV